VESRIEIVFELGVDSGRLNVCVLVEENDGRLVLESDSVALDTANVGFVVVS